MGETALARFPKVFITEALRPAQPPPMSSGIAHDTPTVTSSPKTATQEYKTDAVECGVNVAGKMKTAARRKPANATVRRAIFRLPKRLAQRSETVPPVMSPAAPASSGR